MSVKVSLLDYGAGNIRSIRNAIRSLGYDIIDIITPEDIATAHLIVFPGVGNFGQAMENLENLGLKDPLIAYVKSNRPFFGICIGMQSLFEGSEESPDKKGLGVIPGMITRFNSSAGVRIPQIGWNGVSSVASTPVLDGITLNHKVRYNYYSLLSPCLLMTAGVFCALILCNAI
jgi:glutamine amidotransferase/cyclase